ncbi:HalOD1 output domain-containing protein [Halorussus salinisoli]|uniref:HalOD1 output domain-containing protein n=1 Tax=Halorussus salinisoli TaxID=2558242 RepID=UPI0010C22FE0|nr:HalOD1 output domain-containing protein [Halorussus salinisoli]
MTRFNSTDVAEAKGTCFRNVETTESDGRDSASGRSQRADGDSTYRVHDGESVTEAVVRAVGSETRTDPMGLRPLHSVIDTEALNDLFRSPNGGLARSDGYVAFDYYGRQVQVQADGTIQIQRPG